MGRKLLKEFSEIERKLFWAPVFDNQPYSATASERNRSRREPTFATMERKAADSRPR
ncbi:MAG: hypothetical protein MUP55_01805 [Candidatus Aenigmarchaeota archaeon]|nr:hypothetical protein [Candidatus Aenigmarchaeota archaeon]